MEKDKDVIESSNTEITKVERSVLPKRLNEYSKEDLKALLYLAVGKQDSNIKLFTEDIVITASDLKELNSMIQEKLKHYDTTASISTVDVILEKKRAIQFGLWREFCDFDWNIIEPTQSILIKWDFLIKLPSYEAPQRHTVSVKIANEPDSLHVLQALVSNDADDLEEVEINSAPIVCRVDFINHLLSDELINIVEKWIKTRKKTLLLSNFNEWLRKRRILVARTIHFSFPLFISALSYGFLKFLGSNISQSNAITFGNLEMLFTWLLISALAISSSNIFGRFMASKAYRALEKLGSDQIFLITKGDLNKRDELEVRNKKLFKDFLVNIIISFIINIIAGLVTAYLVTA